MYNILVCDDERDIARSLNIYLAAEGYKVFVAHNGKDALKIFDEHAIHLILMDIMMPELDGVSAMVKLREYSNVPIILLTAKSEDSDKVLGLNLGADDYITKPFTPIEMLARVRSQLRRYMTLGSSVINNDSFRVGGIELDDNQKKVTLDGELISLTPTEFEILKLFIQHPGKVFSPKEIYTSVWKDEFFSGEGTVAVHIRHLREKIEINPSEPRYILVVWGQGYKMEQ